MARNLGLGSRLIRIFLLAGIVLGIIGVACAVRIGALAGETPGIALYAFVVGAVSLLGAAASAAVFAMLAARKVLHRVRILAAAMDRSAEGDLSVKVDVTSSDEIGMLNYNFNTMLEKLSGMVQKVLGSTTALRSISDDVRDASQRGSSAARIQSEGVTGAITAVNEITGSVNDVAGAVENLAQLSEDNVCSIQEMSASIAEVTTHVEALAEAVGEVSASIVELAAAEKQIGAGVNSLMEDSLSTASLVADMDLSIKQVEKNARQTAAISETVRQDAEMGRETVEATISGIGEIRRSSRISFEAIENLSVRAADIDKILQVIAELAEQTNLLALNASIIAAQAGEHGKGFAVVADEIKGLAKRTSVSTKEIAGIIAGVQEETGRAVKAITLSDQRVAEGEKLSQRSGAALNKIVESVQQAAAQVDEIARTTVEQAERSQEMRKSMERVAEMVRQIANATRDQGHSSELIIAAVETMSELSGRVLVSTREQSTTGKRIVRSSEDVTAMVENIRTACTVQTGSSGRIVAAVENIRSSTGMTTEASQLMEGVVTALLAQIEALQKEISGFKVR
ncbi:MAG TPA: HAMP domain-containing methyl-accepting chemotaxis protein [Geobacteraceae bacterium]